MLVEGRINQHPSLRSLASSDAASASSRPEPVLVCHSYSCASLFAHEKLSAQQSFSRHRHWKCRISCSLIRHWLQCWHICTLFILLILSIITLESSSLLAIANSSISISSTGCLFLLSSIAYLCGSVVGLPTRIYRSCIRGPTNLCVSRFSPRSITHHFYCHRWSAKSTWHVYGLRILMTVMVLLVSTSVSVHCLLPSSSSSHSSGARASEHSTQLSSKTVHSIHSGTTAQQQKLRHSFEGQLLKLMNMTTRPRPKNHYKVPEHMLDLYVGLQRMDLLPQISDTTDSRKSFSTVNTKVLRDITIHRNELHSKEPTVMSHFRAPRKKRNTQLPRVTLQGDAKTIISHRPRGHDDVKHRVKRNINFEDFSHETHIQFDIQMPVNEYLKGAELRIYRHSIYERDHSLNKIVVSDDSSSANRRISNLWPLLHWSVRYRSESLSQLAHSSSSSSTSSFLSSSTSTPHPQSSFPTPSPSLSPSSSSFPSQPSRSSNLPLTGSFPNSHSAEASKLKNEPKEHYFYRINIYHLLKPFEERHPVLVKNSSGESLRMVPTIKLIDTQIVDVRQSGWLSFDIFPAVDRWLRNPKENYGLMVTLTDPESKQSLPHSNLLVLDRQDSHVQSANEGEKEAAWQEVQPWLVTYSHEAQNSNRVKRDSPRKSSSWNHSKSGRRHKQKSFSDGQCSRYPLYFDFHAVGWQEWIVAPPGFQIYHCKGECTFPMGAHLNFTNHATIQALVNSVNQAVVPKPCCVPTDLVPMTLLYLQPNENVALHTYQDMVVEGCGCR